MATISEDLMFESGSNSETGNVLFFGSDTDSDSYEALISIPRQDLNRESRSFDSGTRASYFG